MGYVIYPDPMIHKIEDYKVGTGQTFEKIGKLPVWDENHFEKISELRAKGAKRICFKTGPFDPEKTYLEY